MSVVSMIAYAQWVTNPHPQPFSQAWEKGAEGGLRVDLRFDASNLLQDGSLAQSCRIKSMNRVVTHHRISGLPLCCSATSVLVQCSMLVIVLLTTDTANSSSNRARRKPLSPNKAVQPSAQSTVQFRVFVPCSHWLTAIVLFSKGVPCNVISI